MKRAYAPVFAIVSPRRSLGFTKSSSTPGFTIVELLVVIVVIGILAAITIVSYTGIANRAVQASLQSDLSNASVQLKMFLGENNVYPNSISDCPNPSSSNLCLKSSQGNVYSSYSANNTTNPPTYSLSIVNGANIYQISSTNQNPTVLAPAPLNPVADWLATTTGDHYGNFYDLVTHQYATVTRSTPKTIYDPNTQKIYDVPANTLGIRPRSDGKSGVEAEIEEGRTNYVVGSDFNADSNSDGVSDNWIFSTNSTNSVPTGVISNSAVNGSKAQNIQYPGSSSDSSGAVTLFADMTAVGSFFAGENASFSVWVKGTYANCNPIMYLKARDSSGNPISQVNANINPTSNWQRFTLTFSNLPANTSRIYVGIGANLISANGTFNLILDAAQLEKGAFATSYIPTTTGTVTRNADVVTIPTTNWDVSSFTPVFVAGPTPLFTSTTQVPYLLDWFYTANERIDYYEYYSSTIAYSNHLGVAAYQGAGNHNQQTGYHTRVGVYGNPVKTYQDGTSYGSRTDIYVAPSGLPATAYIGYHTGNGQWNGPVQRLTFYSSVFSDSDVLNVTNYVKDGQP